MIERWSKTRDASNNIVWKKTVVSNSQVTTKFDSSLNATDVLVTNPAVTSEPENLNTILGNMKGNINELYGNVKWLSLHGGGGAGTGTGTVTPGTTSTTEIKIYGNYNGVDEYDLTTNNISTISLNEDSYQVKIRLLNAVTGKDYTLVVKNNKKQILRVVLNRSNNTAYVNITNLSTDKSANLTFTITDSDKYSDYNTPSLSLNYASISVDAYLYVVGNPKKTYPILSTQSAMQRNVSSGYKVYYYFKPTADGIVRWKLETNIKDSAKNDNFTLSGTINDIEANVEYLINNDFIDLRNVDTMSNFGIGQFFSATMTVTLYDMAGKPMCSQVLSFSPSIIPDGDFFIVPSNSYWNNTTMEGYSDTFFQNGNNINLDLIIGGDETKYPSLYLIPKIYYGSANDERWYLINDSAVQYGGVTPTETENNFFPNAGYNENQKYKFLTENSEQIALWKTYNKDRLISGIESTGVRTTITIPYSILKSEMFLNTNSGSSKAFADIKIDFYVVAIDDTIQDNDYLILPLDENGDYKLSSFSFKAQVERSSFSVPNYVSGVESGVRHSGSNSYSYFSNKTLYFNLDTINHTSLVSGKENSFNALVDASYNNKLESDAGDKLMPMLIDGGNGITSGLVKDENGYYAFRTSGGAFGYIPSNIFNSQFLKKSTRTFSGISSGFTFEICFRTDEHPTKDGTIFSIGDYSFDGTLSVGIGVDLEEAKFIVNNTDTGETSTISVELSQNTFYQLDFVYELTSMKGSSIDTAIIKIYKNGIPTAVTSIGIENKAPGGSYKYNVNFGSGETNMCFGCKSTETESLRNYADVNFYGIRVYGESLTEQEIIKNWMISKSCINQKVYEDAGGQQHKELDWENVINPMMKNNYYDSSWICSLWDYTNSSRPQVAAGEVLLGEMGEDGWKYDELNKSYYRPLPVVHLKVETKTNKNADQFYASYNESDAGTNNKLIDNQDWNNIFLGSFHYFDTNHQYEISDDNITVGFYMQGTSTQQYRSKNIEIVFVPDDNTLISGDLDVTNDNKPLFTPKPSTWLPENRFTLKADMVDSAHANNAAIGSWINSSGFMPKNAAQQDMDNPYRDMVKETLEGFPCLVFIDWGDSATGAGTKNHNGVEFLGIYSFNLGRGSYYNLGFRKFKNYELSENSNLSTSATIEDMQTTAFANPKECPHASFVRRYKAYSVDDNPNIYSFECTTNEPDVAVGFGQPNIDLLNKVWDLKYTSGSEDVGRERLNEIIKNISYINSDTLNFWEEKQRPTYYYGVHSDGTYNFPLYAYRNKDDVNDYTLEESIDINNPNADGTYNVKPGGNPTPKGVSTGLVRSYMTWYEGLYNFHNEKGIRFNSNGLAISGQPDQTSDYNSFDGKSSTAWKLGYSDNAESGYTPVLDRTPLLSETVAESEWIHYGSFSRYFIIAMIFGMVDSLGKNLTLRSWNIKNKDKGTIVPAFYDMDTALGLDNGGAESVDPTVYVDYWINNNTLSAVDAAMPLNVITEASPYVDTKTTVMYDFYGDGNPVACYNWYDRTDEAAQAAGTTKTLIGLYPKSGNTLPLPSTVRYNLNNSHLWHLIRFMPSIPNNTSNSLYNWAPLGQYALLRGSDDFKFQNIETFFNEYYLKHNEDVGEIVFALDYKEKYMQPYEQAGTTGGVKYNDLIFCHGRRDDYVKKWLNKRINFLDTIYNLRRFYQLGVGSLQMGPESRWISSADYFNTEEAAKSSTTPYLEDTLTNSTKINGSGSGVIRGYVTSNTTTALIINITNTQYRFFLRANVPTKIYFTEPTSPISVHINNISTLTSWSNFKNLRLTEMNANWKFLEVDLSNQNSLRAGTAGAFNLNGMTDLKVCNLQNFQTETSGKMLDLVVTSLKKLEYLNISDSCFQTISLPSGGNLKTLILKNTKLTGEVKLDSLMNLSGTVDFSNVPGITKITINNCPKLTGLTLAGNTSLEEISIKNCPGLGNFNYSGQTGSGEDYESINISKLTKVSITGNCSGVRTISVSNIPSEDLVLDFSGATGLRNLSLSGIISSNMPILPDYYVNSSVKEERTDYDIYNSGTNTSITLNDVNFSGFKFGTINDRGVVTYKEATSSDTYPEIILHKSTEANLSNVILNLAVFGRLGYLSITRCPNIKYIACPPQAIVNSINLNSLASLERVFGHLPMYSEASPVFGYKSLNSFRLCDWNNKNVTDLMVKQKFEEVMDSPEKITEFFELMHDSYEGQVPVQGAIPTTRLSIKSGTETLEDAFYGTAVTMNDVYYIMLLANIYNKNAKSIKSLVKMFQGCTKIVTSYSKSKDLSPSRYIFKWLNSVEFLQNMFTGCFDMKGVIYSPNYEIGDDGTLDHTEIGTMTPLLLSATSFKDIGWGLSIHDDYTYWSPTGTTTYFDESVQWTGVCKNITDVDGILNNVSCIECAIYGEKFNAQNAYFKSSKLLKSFRNAVTINNSFNGISIDFTEGNDTKNLNGRYYTYSTLLKGVTNLKSITSSFNARLVKNTVVVDIFAGNPYSLQHEANDYPNKIVNIEGSFGFTGIDKYAYFCLTDDMFQRIRSTLTTVSPVTGNYSLTNENKGTFSGTNVIKTYVKFNSDGTFENAKFPYGVFRGCAALKDAPSFFSDLDLRYYYKAINLNKKLTSEEFETPFVVDVESNKAEYLLDVPVPDYFASKPYTRVEKIDGTVQHTQDIRMFRDCVSLKNISAMFNRMIPPRMKFIGDNLEPRYIPGGFVLTSGAFEGNNSLENVEYMFADNHYFRGQIPYALLWTGKNSTSTKVTNYGTDSMLAAFAGVSGCSDSESDFMQLRYKMQKNQISKSTGGIYDIASHTDGYVYIPANNEIENPYIVSYNGSEPEVFSYNGNYYPKFRVCNLNSSSDLKQMRYRRIHKDALPWYQTYDATSTISVTSSEANEDVSTYSQNIKNLSYLFYKNDAAGYLPLRYSTEYNSYTNIYANPVAGDDDYLRRAVLYKWNGYSENDYVHTSDSSYTNANLLCDNKSYNKFKFVGNASRDENLVCRYEKLSRADGTPIKFINGSYDPRFFIVNENTNKVTLNKFVFDGIHISDTDKMKLINSVKSKIAQSDKNYTEGRYDADILNSFVESKIPEQILELREYESKAIYYASGSRDTEKTIKDGSLNDIGDNEINQILKMKDIENYFCPSDIFNYVQSNIANIKYAFADTAFQPTKCSLIKYKLFVYESDTLLSQELTENIASGTSEVNSVGYYLEGNPYTGIPGRVSPLLFDDASLFTNIEGLFKGNPQFTPYHYPIVVDDGGYSKIIAGELFDYRTFKPLTNLKSTYLLWANNIVPKEVNINRDTFKSNVNLQYLDYMFAGTQWYNTSADDATYGSQIPQGMFDGLKYIRSARAAFTSPVNYTYRTDESATISYVSNLSGGEPKSAGEYGEYVGGDIGIGTYGVRWVPDDLFNDSSANIEMISNMFFFDRNLTNFPDIYQYEKLKDNNDVNWDKKMYHTAYYLSGMLDETDKKSFSETGYWGLKTPTQMRDNGNKVYYESGTFNSNLV